MQTLSQYFGREDTPMAESPIGKVMVKVLEKYPGLNYEGARSKAQEMLTEASGKRRFVLPVVLSESELAAKKAAGQAYWASRMVKEAA